MSEQDRATPTGTAPSGSTGVGELVVRWTDGSGDVRTRRFSDGFLIGRAQQCDLCLDADSVSRRHAAVFREGGGWWVRDMGSANGTFLDGARIAAAPLGERCTLGIGTDGPQLSVQCEAAGPARPVTKGPPSTEDATVVLPAIGRRTPLPTHEGHGRSPAVPGGPRPPPQGPATPSPGPSGTASPERLAQRYLREPLAEDAGEFTRAFRAVFRAEQHKLKRRNFFMLSAVIALATLALAGGGLFLLWQQQQIEGARRLAIDLFYDIKGLELELARLHARIAESRDASLVAEMEANQARLAAMSARYDRYIEENALLTPSADQKELTILRVARLLGECELNMPDSFRDEVNTYIVKWKSTGRLQRAIATARAKGYVDIVREALADNGLPPQFFYLAIQESNFNEQAIGPPTRYGIAKGAWQFIPDTATRFGLSVGTLTEEPVFDPEDQRFDFRASTKAAARYLRDIYNTDAQASGLLVMASYNWGEGNIIKRLRSMPENPRERNFWKLVDKYEIPAETYDYVLSIFAAAVIGEKPRLFGFEFEKPL